MAKDGQIKINTQSFKYTPNHERILCSTLQAAEKTISILENQNIPYYHTLNKNTQKHNITCNMQLSTTTYNQIKTTANITIEQHHRKLEYYKTQTTLTDIGSAVRKHIQENQTTNTEINKHTMNALNNIWPNTDTLTPKQVTKYVAKYPFLKQLFPHIPIVPDYKRSASTLRILHLNCNKIQIKLNLL